MTPRSPTQPIERQLPAVAKDDALRLPQLDALRGLAALVVVLHHAYLALPDGDPARHWCDGCPALAILTLGRPAVILFFTLSGFVLTLSLSDAGGVSYALRRATRLLPPFWAALGFAALLCALVPRRHATALSPWFNDQWAASIPFGDLVSTLPLVVGPGRYAIDHVVWSLVHELRLSLALPLLLLAARRSGGLACLAISAALAGMAEVAIVRDPSAFPTGYHGYLFDAPDLLSSLAITLRFLPAFALGAVLARHARRASAWATARPASTLALGVAGLAILSQPSEYVMMLGSTIVVAVAATSPHIARGLACRPLRWLGRVSFSLYLVHLPTMLALGLTLEARMPTLMVLGLSTSLSLVIAELFHRGVERPSMRFSRHLATWRVPTGSQVFALCRPTVLVCVTLLMHVSLRA